MTNAIILTNLLIDLATRAAAAGALIRRAQSEGRDITDAELDQLVAADDAKKAELDAAIARARGG